MFFLVLLYALITPYTCCAYPDIEKIPQKDAVKLELFFDYLMHNSMVGYSLCGDKPVSMESFPKLSMILPHYAVNVYVKHPGYFILWEGWTVWERYSHLFPSDKFVLRFIPGKSTLVIVNKKSAKLVIGENIDLFRKHLNSDESVEEILEKICRPTDEDYLVGKNCILLGILLGYGRNNAIAFSNKSYIQRLESYHTYEASNPLDAFLNPGLMIIQNGTNDKENDHVRRVFRDAKKKMRSDFRDGNYLSKVVEILTEE